MLRKLAKKYLPTPVQNRLRQRTIRIRKVKDTPGSWTASILRYRSPYGTYRSVFDLIEEIAAKTEQRGALPLWGGYSNIENYPTTIGQGAIRTSNQVRSNKKMGEFFTWLVLQRKPSLILEFGTAFGVSGMYWLAGLQINKKGHLFTFEPNEIWANIARENLSKIGNRYTLTIGTFEDNVSLISNQKSDVDLAFIDAIHTSDFVYAQLDLVLKKAAPGALIAFDDIDFSENMKSFWKEISTNDGYAAAFEINGVGIVELN